MTYHWLCTCGASGTDTSTAVTDSAHADAKHSATCPGLVLTSLDADALARMRARAGGEGGELVAERFMDLLHPELSLYGIDAAREAREQVAALVGIARETAGGTL